LHNLLRTAVVMVGCEGVIERMHLPDDFLEELSLAPAAMTAPPPQLLPLASAAPAPDKPTPASTPEPVSSFGADGQRLQDVAISAMAQMLRQHKGNVSAAAKALGVSRNTIYRKKHLLPPDVLS
jgi:sigma-54 dependent transcriptional regulator, acetoin dehydrogenase operon transcriptional activator AcoR